MKEKIKELMDQLYSKVQMDLYRKINQINSGAIEGINLYEMSYIDTIHELGEPTFSELSERLSVTKPAVTHMINQLIKRGYVEKKQDPLDKRVYRLRITQKLDEYFAMDINLDDIFYKYIFSIITDEEMKVLYEFLEKTKKNYPDLFQKL